MGSLQPWPKLGFLFKFCKVKFCFICTAHASLGLLFPIDFNGKASFFYFRLESFVPTQSSFISLESSFDSGSESVGNFKIQRLESEKSWFELSPIDFNGEGSIS